MENLVNLLLGYGFVIAASLFNITVSILLGMIPLRIFKLNPKNLTLYLIHSFWVGYTLLTALLMFINIFQPIKFWVIMPIIALLSVFSLLLNRKVLISSDISLKFLKNSIGTIALLSIIALVFIRSNFSGHYAFDMYNYHFQLLYHTNNYPTIPGVINLFTWYGNMYATVYQSAFLQTLIPQGSLEPIFTGYLFFISSHTIVLAFLVTLVSFYTTEEPNNNSHKIPFKNKLFLSYILASALIFLIFKISSPYLTGTGTEGLRNHIPDLNYYLLNFVIVLYLVYYYSKANQKVLFFVIVSLAIAQIFLKMSSALMSLLIVIIALIIYLKNKNSRVQLLAYITFFIVLFSPYLATNIIKSGTLLFPSSALDLHLPWSNVGKLDTYIGGVLQWARNPRIDMSLYGTQKDFWNFTFVAPWLKMYFPYFSSMLGLLLSAFSMLIFFVKKYKTPTKEVLLPTLIFGIVWVLLITFWFLFGPDVRFAGALFILPSVFIFALALAAVPDWKFDKKYFLPAIIILAFAAIDVGMLKERIVVSSLKTPVKSSYEGTTVYYGKWKSGYQCGYTNLMPCTQSIGKNYSFIYPDKWYEGLMKKSEIRSKVENTKENH